ncbi:MAG: hypothetical protein ABJE95_29615 [Byssovorax sp.]
MRRSSMVFLAPAAALAAICGCGGGGEAATATSGSGGAAATTTSASGTGGAATTAGGGGASATSTGPGGGSGSSTTSASSSASASSSGTGSSPCTWAAVNPCGPGLYCDAPTCQQGTCVPSGGVETTDRTPVCGCDNVTYWNVSVAKSQGQAVASGAACAPGKTCGGFANLKCPGAASCAYQLLDSGQCNAADLGGTCWAMPAVCPPVVGSKTRACGAGKCAGECDLIKSSTSYYVDSACP